MSDESPLLVRHLGDLARYMAWADATVWQAIMATPQATDDARTADTLYHLHLVQHIFLQAWSRTAFAVRQRHEFQKLDELSAWGQEARRGVLRFVEGTSAGDLEKPFRMPWAAHFERSSRQPAGLHTLGESMLQVFLHTQHHRGQVCARLREVGGEPPTVDFIVWLWSGRPFGTPGV
jgi:uncharacterized damage-inducible protein DinB